MEANECRWYWGSKWCAEAVSQKQTVLLKNVKKQFEAQMNYTSNVTLRLQVEESKNWGGE